MHSAVTTLEKGDLYINFLHSIISSKTVVTTIPSYPAQLRFTAIHRTLQAPELMLPWQTNSILYIGKFLSEGFVLRYFAAFCVLADFTDLRLISQKHGKSGQIADVCSSQIVVKICGFTTKDFADDYIIAYFSGFA